MLDVTRIVLEINPPGTVIGVITKALSAEPSRDQALALCKLAQFYTVFDRKEEAEAVYQAAIHIAHEAAPNDRLVEAIKKDFALLQRMRETGFLHGLRPSDCTTDTRSILRGPDRMFITHEPPKEVADIVFDSLEAEPTTYIAQGLRALAAKCSLSGKTEEAEALLLTGLEVANNAGCDEELMADLFADFDALLETIRQRNVTAEN